MKAEIISIGDELLIGQTVNTNATWIGKELSLRGISTHEVLTIKDSRAEILEAIERGLQQTELVIITGGLGPTNDDITKRIIAEYFDRKLVMHAATLERVKEYFKSRKKGFLEVNKNQALVPENCTILQNDNGTAPGMWLEKDGKVLICLPGVPYEMKAILSNYGFPKIEAKFNLATLFYKTILTQGIGEATIANVMEDWEESIKKEGFNLAYLPSLGQVKLRISSERGKVDAPKIDAYFAELKNAFPKHVFGNDLETLSEVIGKLLTEANATLGTAESCTSGALSNEIVATPGASAYFMGGISAYSYASKEKILGVQPESLKKHGAVSEEVVKQMALGAKEILGVDYCLSTSGIAGPGGGIAEKPVGTVWIGLATNKKVIAKQFYFGNHRQRNISLTVLTALNMLRCEVLGVEW